MSFAATSWAWRQVCTSPGCKLVLLALADIANERHECWPALKNLGVITCQSPADVSRRLIRLEAAGLIGRTARRAECGTHLPCLITLHVDGGAAL